LLSFGVLFESVYAAIASGSGPDIFFEGSYTAALVAGSWRGLAVALLCFGSMFWSFSKWGARSGDWSRIDRVGGLRWSVLGVVATLAWNYAGHPYNYYFDQPTCGIAGCSCC